MSARSRHPHIAIAIPYVGKTLGGSSFDIIVLGSHFIQVRARARVSGGSGLHTHTPLESEVLGRSSFPWPVSGVGSIFSALAY